VFDGAHEPTPVTRGWLRASHLKLDQKRSLPYRPWHKHDEVEPLVPGTAYALDVELWPTSMVFPQGYRLALTLQGRDFEFEGIAGRILHNDPRDRDPKRCGTRHTIVTGGEHESFLLVPAMD
jgi:predicted acyl esterase